MIPATSVIIPTLNEEGYLPRLLDSLRKVSAPLDIIVVDGASEDNTVKVVEKYQTLFEKPSSLTLVRSEARGIALQRNRGAEIAKHDILIFCDADVIFPTGTYEKMLTQFKTKGYIIAAPLLKPIEPGIQRKGIYQFFRLIQKMLILLGRPYYPGACIVTFKRAFTEVGGFDTRIILGEDIDYSMRAAKFGSFGLLNVKVLFSDRRIIKYGYSWILSDIPNLFRLLFTGRLKPESIYYPFGEYGGQKAHHVTNNIGR